MAWKSVSSTLSQISPRLGCSFEWNPAFRLLHMNDTSRCSIGVCICWAPPSGRSICKLCDDGCPEYGLNAVIAHSLWIGDFHGVQRLFVWYYSSETGDITVKFSVNVTSNTSREEFLRKLAQCPPGGFSGGCPDAVTWFEADHLDFFAVKANIVSACPFLNSIQFDGLDCRILVAGMPRSTSSANLNTLGKSGGNLRQRRRPIYLISG